MVLKNPRVPQRKKVVGYGPCMSVLTPMQRKFVEVLYEKPGISQQHAVELAGYRGKYEAMKKMGSRLMRNPMVLDAIKECGETTLRGKLPKTVHAIDNIINDPAHRGHVKVLTGVLDRTGLHAISETKTTVTHTIDRTDLLAKIAALIEKNNIVSLPAPIKDGDTVVLLEATEIGD